MRMIAGGLFVVAAAAAVSAGQTSRPGEMTQARVWVENRGETQAVPVRIESASRDITPLRVMIVNGEAVGSAVAPVPVRAARTAWEYRTVSIRRDDAAATLAPLGPEGWEVTGVTWAAGDAATVLLKRVR
jgi:hypothetical protein